MRYNEKNGKRRNEMSECKLCPRLCGVNRAYGEIGYCGQGDTMTISRIALHPFEEPPISGEKGSGTVFFCGCSLGCVFCQNKAISRGGAVGREYGVEELAAQMLRLRDEGATNVNLVTATHFTDKVAETLRMVRPELGIPVVWNSSGYESVETLRMLDGLVDVYLPDFKYSSSELSALYSSASDYPIVAIEAIKEMHRQVGKYEYADDGTLKSGVVIRHLVLPSHRKDSIEVVKALSDAVPVSDVLLSLMSQYTPDFALDTPYKQLHRRVTRFEYESVLDVAIKLGFDGFSQSGESAIKEYTPDF